MNTQATASNFHAPEPEGSFIAQHSPSSGDVVKRWKRGDTGPDGRRFWAYQASREIWVVDHKFADRLENARKYCRAWHRSNRAYAKNRAREYGKINSSKIVEKVAEWRRANPEKNLATDRAYRAKNREKIAKRKRVWAAAKKKTHPEYAARVRLRRTIYMYFKRHPTLKSPLCKKSRDGAIFLGWMARNMPGLSGFDIDHLIPLSKWGDVNVPYHPNAPENVRWIPAAENRHVKKARMPTPEELQAHFLLVAEWRSQIKTVVPESK